MSEGVPSAETEVAAHPAPAGGEPIHPRPPTPSGDQAPRKKASNLVLRLITAAMLIPPVTYAIFQGGLWVLGTVLVVTALGLREFYLLIEAKGAEPLRGVGMLAGLSLPVVAYVGSEYHATILLSVVLLGLLVAQLGKAQIKESLASISGTFFGVFYVGWLLSHAIVLRGFYGAVEDRFGPEFVVGMHPEVGAYYLFFTIAVVIGGDVGAYFAGRRWGKRKLAPKVSPGKTVEGALGALVFAVFIAYLLKTGFDNFLPAYSSQLSYMATGILAVVLSVVGIVGDLVESLLKRDAQVKDTGSLLPGTGGVMDRIDSNLLGIPVMYYLLLAYSWLSVAVPPVVG